MSSKEYKPVIGLEIHVQLATKTKMFERITSDWFGKEPNTVVGPLTMGLPGTLPVPNKKAIQWAILIGKALNCKTNRVSKFDRKHYFYPDLPKAYQISQYDQPFSYEGYYEFVSKASGKKKRIGITRVHMEEDTGKLIHEGDESLVDFNRAGMPLVEIVTEPDFDNTDDMKQFLEELRAIIRYLGVSDADMDKGSMRLEPNISVRKTGEDGLPNYKVEVKNINSFRFAKQAADFEIKRHIKLLEKGEIPVQETRGYNEGKGITISQRIKEEAEDYRYFPEPDIPPFELDDDFIRKIEEMMVELPHEKVERYVDKLGLKEDDAYIITRDVDTAKYFEAIVDLVDQKLAPKVASIIVNKRISTDMEPKAFAQKAEKMLKPKDTDMNALSDAVSQVISSNESIVEQFKSGKENAINALIGQVMGRMKGQADPQTVKSELEKAITS